MNNKKNDFVARFSIEDVAEWVKSEGVKDGYILDHQQIHIEEVNKDNERIIFEGHITTRQDS